ncbi:unannotated protein [freshwater metagenome]|uniref:Unannotated protein n=1 Tax=freshwater metagenome TaxID=449393 RepID=A0A6J6ITM5_9ZZZZ
MDSIDHVVLQAIIAVRQSLPNPSLWAGAAANSCANSMEALARELEIMLHRLNSWAS